MSPTDDDTNTRTAIDLDAYFGRATGGLSAEAGTITHAGFVAVVGRPNVGKSTLINALVGRKISITTPKPQTTRHRVLGIHTADGHQTVFVDTPGIHAGAKTTFNRMLNRTAADSLAGVDLALWVLAGTVCNDEDEIVLTRLLQSGLPIGLVLNKSDHVKNKTELLPQLAMLTSRIPPEQLAFAIPISALKKHNLDALMSEVHARLPEAEIGLFPAGQHTDRSERFQAAELVREQLYMALDQELPYRISVEIELDEPGEDNKRHIGAVIWVAEDRHKGMVIGKGGALLKKVGMQARKRLSKHFDEPIHLELWCRVKRGWGDDERALAQLGYDLPESTKKKG